MPIITSAISAYQHFFPISAYQLSANNFKAYNLREMEFQNFPFRSSILVWAVLAKASIDKNVLLAHPSFKVHYGHRNNILAYILICIEYDAAIWVHLVDLGNTLLTFTIAFWPLFPRSTTWTQMAVSYSKS